MLHPHLTPLSPPFFPFFLFLSSSVRYPCGPPFFSRGRPLSCFEVEGGFFISLPPPLSWWLLRSLEVDGVGVGGSGRSFLAWSPRLSRVRLRVHGQQGYAGGREGEREGPWKRKMEEKEGRGKIRPLPREGFVHLAFNNLRSRTAAVTSNYTVFLRILLCLFFMGKQKYPMQDVDMNRKIKGSMSNACLNLL